MDKTEVTPDGWVVTDLETFRLLADHQPPRPYGYLHQLSVDGRSWKPITMWFIGGGLIIVAVALGWWLLLPLGGTILLSWFRMFRRTVRYVREAPVDVGVVGALRPHPLLRDYSTAIAMIADGREVPVTFPTLLADGIIKGGGQAEVLFLDDPRSEFSLGLGVRAADDGRVALTRSAP